MKLRRTFGWLLMPALLWPVYAQASYHFHNARLDWFGADFIGWVRVEQDLTGQVPSPGQSRVKLRVIEQVKGEAIETLQLVYTDSSEGDPKRDVIELVPAGDQQSWKEDIGKEFFAYLGRGEGGEFAALAGNYFLIERGVVQYLPKEYCDYYHVSESPRIRTLVTKVREKRPDATLHIGQPLLASPLRRGFRRVESPHMSIEAFFRAVAEGRRVEAVQILHRTGSASLSDFIKDAQEDALRKAFGRLKVVMEAVSENHAIALWSRTRTGRGVPRVGICYGKSRAGES